MQGWDLSMKHCKNEWILENESAEENNNKITPTRQNNRKKCIEIIVH